MQNASQPQIVELQFDQQPIQCFIENGLRLMPVRTICEIIGVDYIAQDKWLKSDEFFNQLYNPDYTVAIDGKQRRMNCLNIMAVFGWVCSISKNRRSAESIHRQDRFKEWLFNLLLQGLQPDEAIAKARAYELELLKKVEELEGEEAMKLQELKEIRQDLKQSRKTLEEVQYNNVTGQISMDLFDTPPLN